MHNIPDYHHDLVGNDEDENEACILIEMDQTIKQASACTKEILGLNPANIIGLHFSRLFKKENLINPLDTFLPLIKKVEVISGFSTGLASNSETRITWNIVKQTENKEVNYLLTACRAKTCNRQSKDETSTKRKVRSFNEKDELATTKKTDKIKLMKELCHEITGNIAPPKKTLAEYIEYVRDYFENIIACMPGAIFWKNVDGTYLGCNNELAKLIGLKSRKEIIGKTDYQIFTKEQADHLVKIDRQIIKTKNEMLVEESGNVFDGSTMHVLTSKVPILDHERKNITGILGISLDITARKKAEKALLEAKEAAENANKVLQVFAGAIAHELRTPLTTIGSSIRGIKRYLDDLYAGYKLAKDHKLKVPHIREHHLQQLPQVADNILEEVNFSQSIININLAQIGLQNSTHVKLDRCDVNECVKEAITRFAFKNEGEKELICVDANYNFEFIGSQLLMIHVILNLLKNALYFIEAADKGVIVISYKHGATHNELIFTDTGPGIDPEIQEKIFDQFYSKRQHGAGIGLAFCKQVIEKFTGTIHCESDYGKYTRFVLTLPTINHYHSLQESEGTSYV